MTAEKKRPIAPGPQQSIQQTQQDILLAQSKDSIYSDTENMRDPYHNTISGPYRPGPTMRNIPPSSLPVTRGIHFSLPTSQYGNEFRRNNPTGENTGLPIMLERIRRCFWGRTSQQDIDMLAISLAHIFARTDTLYHVLLPELSASLQQHPHHVEQPLTEQDLPLHYCVWTLLQEIESTLEHLEPLCNLLITTSIHIVEALDRSCSIYGAARIKRQLLLHGADEESTEVLAAISTDHIADSTYFHWMHAVSQVSARLQHWRTNNHTRLLFAQRFALFATMIPTLGQLDSALDLIAENTQAIFGLLLPEFHTVARGDDETAATLLLDIVQKIDQIQLAMDTQIEPLHILTREYAYKTTLH